jgi:glucokinase
MMRNDPLEAKHLYRLMLEAAGKVGYLSGDSCKVLMALALRPESRGSMLALKQVTCIDDNTALAQAISDLENFNLARFDGKGGILINEALFTEK